MSGESGAYVHLGWLHDDPRAVIDGYAHEPHELLTCTRCGALVESEMGVQYHERWHDQFAAHSDPTGQSCTPDCPSCDLLHLDRFSCMGCSCRAAHSEPSTPPDRGS